MLKRMSTSREPMAKVDTTWLRMEQPTNLMMITGVSTFTGSVDFERLKETIKTRFLAFRRFRQKVVDTSTGAFWEIDRDFDLDTHVRRVALPGKADKAELEELVSHLASSPLAQTRPLWQFHLVENYVGGQVLISRIHHCIADGIALIQVMLSLTDTGPGDRPSAKDPQTWKKKRIAESNIFRRLVQPAKEGIGWATHFSKRMLNESQRLIADPVRASKYAEEAGDILAELGHALTLSNDPKTRFKGDLGIRKQVAWAEPIPLAEVKAVGQAFGCTVNDVLIASATGALRSYLSEVEGQVPGEVEIRATVPVNLRPLEHAKELGNHFGLVFLQLPLGEENPIRRVELVHERMNELKSSKQAAVAFGLLAALGIGPGFLQKPALDLLSLKATTVLTNVPGPKQPLFMAGSEIKEMMFWVPQNGTIGMGISILSYNEQVYFGLITDKKLVPDPGNVIGRFKPEFETLLYSAMLFPGEEQPDLEFLSEYLE